jgi:hypothetical protein
MHKKPVMFRMFPPPQQPLAASPSRSPILVQPLYVPFSNKTSTQVKFISIH